MPLRRVLSVTLGQLGTFSFLQHSQRLLEEAGFRDMEELRNMAGLPAGRLICRTVTGLDSKPEGDPLIHAAILGLCNSAFYSPGRPIIWTESRLRRQVELIAVENFYED
ncbi:MAG: hypothetical protein WEB60_07020 [Terrimicrobiaceae bacterium]